MRVGALVTIHHPELVNLYGCAIGDDTRIGTSVEIQKGATIGPRCKISSHTFVCEGVTIEDEVFVGGHGVMFINDRYPRATAHGRPGARPTGRWCRPSHLLLTAKAVNSRRRAAYLIQTKIGSK